jgi:FkbM family methyltransferase
VNPIGRGIRNAGRRIVDRAGYVIRHRQPAASHLRPIGDQDSVFEDFKARGFDPALIFDIGAATGSWTGSVRPIFPNATFVTVEPRDTGFEPTVRSAIGSEEGTGTLTDWDTGSTLLTTDTATGPRYQVPVTTMNALAKRFGTPDLVKLDVEGFELEALKGGGDLLGLTELFVIEVALYRFSGRPMIHEVAPFMADRGYFVYDISGFIRRPFDGAVGMIDLCFSRSLRGPENEWHARGMRH